MKHYPNPPTFPCLILAGLTIGFATATHLALATTSLQLGFTVPSSLNESNRQAVLEWNAEPAKTYLVQSADELVSGTPWKTETPVRAATNGPIKWMAPEALRTQKYYRLILPQPEVFSVEPAFVNSADPGALFYLIGQCLPTNGSVVINGLNFTPTLVDSNGGWLAISLNGLPPGTPVFGNILVLDAGSNIVTTLPLQSPVLYGTEMTTEQLQGPPDEPLASPQAMLAAWLSKKGYDYYRARSDMNAAGMHNNPYFVDNQMAGDMPMSSRRGYDYYKAQSDMAAAGRHHNPLFQENNNSGEMPLHSKKGYDYYMAQSKFSAPTESLGFDSKSSGHLVEVLEIVGHQINYALWGGGGGGSDGPGGGEVPRASARFRPGNQGVINFTVTRDAFAPGGGGGEGKKGINAVNVKLAFSSGELLSEEADLAIPGVGLDFIWARTYRSRTGPNTAQGAGWDFSYNVSLTQNGDGTITLRPGNGRADTFYPNGTNGWARDEYFCEVRDLNGDGMPDVLFADTGRWLFKPLGTPAGGKLWQIIDRNGNTMTLDYSFKGQLTTIVDDLGRTNLVAYSLAGKITSVTDFSGRVVRYEYDGNGDLVACISPPVTGTPNGNDFPGGKTNRYSYTSGQLDDRLNHNLIGCTDGKGQAWLTVVYHATNDPASLDFDAVASVLRGVDKKDIRRGMVISKPGYVTRLLQAIINDGVGNVTECFYDSRFRPMEVREFTGRANPALPTTATENRPTGKLRATDPDYFETRFEWNADSLCTRVVYPRGNSEEMVYERAFNQNSAQSNRCHAGDLRIFRELACCDQDDDGDGILDMLTTTFEYDPRFGSPATVCGKKLYVGNLPYSRSGGLPIGNGMAIKEKGTGADNNRFARGPRQTTSLDGSYGGAVTAKTVLGTFTLIGCGLKPTRMVDPRGIVTTGTYDTNGNCTKVDKRSYTAGHFILELDGAASYNSHGQLTAITNAADGNGYRRVDAFDYYSSGPAAGFLQSETCDATGLALTTSYEYDPRANVTRVVDARGNDTLYTYNALEQCVHAETPANTTYPIINWDVSLAYDANNNLIRCDEGNRDSTGTPDAMNPQWTTLFEHDALDRLTGVVQEISEGGGLPGRYATNHFFYDGNDNLVAVHSPLAVAGVEPGNIVTNLYDERDLLFCRITAPGTAIAENKDVEVDFNGNVTRILQTPDAGGAKIPVAAFTHDGFDRLVSLRDAMGNERQFNYDRNSNLIRVRTYGELSDVAGAKSNVRLAETRHEYDSLNRVTRGVASFFDLLTQSPLTDGESATTVTYAPNGGCTSITDDNGHTTRYTYDNAGRLAAVTDPKTNVISFTYDGCDNVLSATQLDRSDLAGSSQFSVVYGYDRLHRLTRSVDNVGNTNLYAYDSRGNVVSHLDPRENESFAVFDGLGRCVATTNYVGKDRGITINTSHVEYDPNSRRTAFTDSNGNTTRYTYDGRDRCVAVTEADGTSSSLIWSPRSNLVREQDANGTVTTNTYDLLDRCVRRDITPGPGVAATTTFETFAYDGRSQLVAATNDAAHNEFAYDSLGRNTRGTSGGLGAVVSTHDGVGNRLSMTYPSGRGVTYTYDALDQVASVGSSSGGLPPTTLATFAYEGPGRMGRISRANNVNTRIQWNGLVNPPNAAGDFGWGQVKGINHQIAGGGTVIDQRRATYDQKQNKTLRAQTTPFYQGGDLTTNVFEYDPVDRLSRAIAVKGTGATLRTYVLDGVGNRQLVISNGVVEPYLMEATIPPADFQMNQYTLTPFVVAPEQYDANGNLIGRTTASTQRQYLYDSADRLVAVNDLSGGLPAPLATYNYDALGRRSSKTIYPSGLPPVTTQYVHDVVEHRDSDDRVRILEERVAGAVSRVYCWASLHTTAAKHCAIVTDEYSPLVAFNGTGEPLYYHADELGNTLALTDAGGNVVERCDYDDYGLPIFLSTDGLPTGETESGVGNPFLFHGLEWDTETGWYHDGGMAGENPLYDPQTGRAGRGKVKDVKHNGMGFAANNPWSGGAPDAMKNGTVKFFNEAKGF